MKLITYSQVPDYENDKIGKIVHSKQLWVVIIISIFIVGYAVYPRATVPSDATPNTDPDNTPTANTLTDVEGNVYKTIKIGNQTWMAENLRATKYNDGTEIPQVVSGSTWGSLTTPGYCWLDNKAANKDSYGALYNWYAVDTGKLAPKGWHIPSEEEWAALSKHLGGDSVAGGKMKEKGTTHWFSPNSGATNESGFTALPCSTRNYDGLTFYVVGDGAYFWTTTEFDAYNAWVRSVLCDSTAIKRFNAYKSYGRSVRCVKNATQSEPAAGTVTDVEGNIYKTIKIGNQTWMADNLRTTKLNDGKSIYYRPSSSDWASVYAPAYCWPNNDTSNKEDYGALYNWYAVQTNILAPVGWHVPTDDEWKTLTDYLGGSSVAGGKLKELGFSVRWAGIRTYDGIYGYFGEIEKYWSTTEGGWHPGDVLYRTIGKFDSVFERSSHQKMDGHSVRCVKNS